ALPKFDLQVHDRLHLRGPRVADDAARSERARSKFHAALEPADDLFFGEPLRRFSNNRVIVEALVLGADANQIRLGFVRREARAKVRSLHRIGLTAFCLGCRARVPKVLVPNGQRRAKRTAGIARRRLDPKFLEWSFAKNLAVADAIERDT